MVQPLLAPNRFAHIRCLLVEDSEFDQRRIRRVLDHLGIQKLDVADSLGAARAFLSTSRVDLILLDNGLPDGLGVDFALELKEQPNLANIPVVMVSDWPTPFMYDKALIARVRQVLRKDEFNLARAIKVLSFSREMPRTIPS